MPQRRIVLSRSWENGIPTVILKLEIEPGSYAAKHGWLDAMRYAVTDWCKTTDVGRSIYAYAGTDMNIGDLAGHIEQDQDLRHRLRTRGVEVVSLEGVDLGEAIEYDTTLVHEVEQEQALPDGLTAADLIGGEN